MRAGQLDRNSTIYTEKVLRHLDFESLLPQNHPRGLGNGPPLQVHGAPSPRSDEASEDTELGDAGNNPNSTPREELACSSTCPRLSGALCRDGSDCIGSAGQPSGTSAAQPPRASRV